MTIRNDSRVELTLDTSKLKTRLETRVFILSEWMKEAGGQKHRYFVETLSDGKRIYLERPASLNQGCDFVILVEDLSLFKNGNDKPPKHDDLYNDLVRKKKRIRPDTWVHLLKSIEAVHEISSYEIPPDSKSEIDRLSSEISLENMSVELIHFLCKWFFIEQDVTYWAGEGRNMFWQVIKEIE